MPLVLGFAGLLGMAVLLTSAITGASFADVIAGRGGELYRQKRAEHDNVAGGLIDAGLDALAGNQTAASPGGASTPTRNASAVTPNTNWNPLGKPIAAWMVPILDWASRNGWTGTVLSGIRTPDEQIVAANNYGIQHYPDGPLASNHVEGHAGAVDVTNPEELARVLRGWRGERKLIWGGPVMGDRPHFSANGH